jgi:hypothetical protein
MARRGAGRNYSEEAAIMLLILAIVLLVAWLLGLVAFHVTAWFIHLLVVVAVIVAILHFVRGPARP